jgi:hemolysin activation/secretion protein
MVISHKFGRPLRWLLAFCLSATFSLVAAPVISKDSPDSNLSTNARSTVENNLASRFMIKNYVIEGNTLLATNLTASLFAKYTGAEVGLDQIVQAASALQLLYRQQGYHTMSVVISPARITNGLVTLNVFQGAFSQIVVNGNRYSNFGSDDTNTASNLSANKPTTTNTPPAPKFVVSNYLVTGNTLLSPQVIKSAVFKHMGTNVTVEDVLAAGLDLQKEYRNRGYPTVNVTIPPQKIADGLVKIQVIEGRLAAIRVTGNHYFSSNNVMRALPSLHTNQILNGQIFQAELNQANANQDRQIYPVIDPGLEPGTTDLTLKIQDRLPLHGKMDLDNQSSPGTPDLRLNTSLVYDNLWNLEHALGFQYGFSPEAYKSASAEAEQEYASSPPIYNQLYKSGNEWNFYDLPLVANYSAFYRLPLGNPQPLEDIIASKPGSFGYDEATRKFNVPPPTGQPELTFFASRSTIDTGFTTISQKTYQGSDGTNSLFESTAQQDLTVNNDVGFRLSLPLASTPDFHSSFSGGLDFKNYNLSSYGINSFTLYASEYDPQADISLPLVSQNFNPVPITINHLNYLPVSLRYDGSLRDPLGTTVFGLGLSVNSWYSGTTSTNGATKFTGLKSLQSLTGSTESSGHWVILTPSISHDFTIYTNWVLTVRADGQWASEPLISNEQFGAGGVNSVRGYHEGEVFGDTGWHVSVEQQTPPHIVGMVGADTPLIIRGSVYMDYAQTYLLDPQGRTDSIDLWGTGFGGVASIGSHWEARFLFSMPLLRTSLTQAYQPFFNFSLTAQF